MKIRISLVHFLNAAPLGWSFLHGPHKEDFEVIPASPSRCAEQLASGEADVAVLPSIEFQRIPDLSILPGISISALDAVRSIIMVRRRGREIRTVALDTSSRTSVVLLKLLLEVRMGLKPQYADHNPDLTEMMRSCDAALLIGDAALKVTDGEFEMLDLARAWVEWQGVPFTFAFWACRSNLCRSEDLTSIFLEARNWGLRSRGLIVREYAEKLGLPEAFLASYLSRNVNYDLSPRHIEGLERFYRLAHASGLIPECRPLKFLPTMKIGAPLSQR